MVVQFKGMARRVIEVVALVITLLACLYFTWYATRFVLESYQMNDMSQGLFPIALWIPQSGMVAGLMLMCLAVAESLFNTLRGGSAPLNEDAVMSRAVNEL